MSSGSVMSGFLQYGDHPKTWQRVWSNVPRTEPPVLHLYAASQVESCLWRKKTPLSSCESHMSIRKKTMLCCCIHTLL